MHIEAITEQKGQFMYLLLVADPSPAMILKYLEQSYLFALYEQDEVYGVIALEPHNEQQIEIKNIAVKAEAQGKGYGKRLILYAIQQCRLYGYKKITVATGNSSIGNLAFYQKVGLRFQSVVRDFFVEYYEEPIFENGIQCKDKVILDMDL